VGSTPLVLRYDVVWTLDNDTSDPDLEIREAAPLLQIAIRDRLRTNERPRRDVDRADAIVRHSGEQSVQILRAFLPDVFSNDFAPRIPQ
jgi:hypothetical protein